MNEEVNKFDEKMKKYGEKHLSKGYNLSDSCERQTQKEVMKQNVKEMESSPLAPISEDKNKLLQRYGEMFTSLSFKFNNRLFFTNNFINCT